MVKWFVSGYLTLNEDAQNYFFPGDKLIVVFKLSGHFQEVGMDDNGKG